MIDPQQRSALDGPVLIEMLATGAAVLEANTEAVNALNVFPVPDGDTGINMVLTLRAAFEEMERCTEDGIGPLAAAVAHGALMGARGNAGVILSQFLRGLARGLKDRGKADAEDLAMALQEGATEAYKAVAKPVEGTMLTVIRETAEQAGTVARDGADVVTLLREARDAAHASLARTPELLPVLKEAGVVDAGGQGFVLLLEGMVRTLTGEDPEEVRLETTAVAPGQVSAAYLAATQQEQYGFCTQFIIEGQDLDPDAIRAHLATMAESTVVVGDASTISVHVHARDPQPIIDYGGSLGMLRNVQTADMDQQHREFLAAHGPGQAVMAPLAVVAVAQGQGMERVFHSLGAIVVPGGRTMNPSTLDVLRATDATPAREVLLLPNNPNILPVARQVAEVSQKPVHVVPSRTVPQGIAALLAFDVQQGSSENAATMERAFGEVRTGEVTNAIRDATVEGVSVRAGQAMGLLDDHLVAAGTPLEVLLAVVERAGPGAGALVTLYWGGSVTEEEARQTADRVRERLPGVEVEVVQGGQPHDQYIISVES